MYGCTSFLYISFCWIKNIQILNWGLVFDGVVPSPSAPAAPLASCFFSQMQWSPQLAKPLGPHWFGLTISVITICFAFWYIIWFGLLLTLRGPRDFLTYKRYSLVTHPKMIGLSWAEYLCNPLSHAESRWGVTMCTKPIWEIDTQNDALGSGNSLDVTVYLLGNC
jgi:hypothetical protein